MRSVYAVSRSVIRSVLRVLRSPEHTITNNALYVSDSARNVLSTKPKRNLALNSVLAQQSFVAKVTVCRHVVSQQTFVSGPAQACNPKAEAGRTSAHGGDMSS